MAEKSRLDALYADRAKADFISSVSPEYVVINFSSPMFASNLGANFDACSLICSIINQIKLTSSFCD